MPIILRDGQSAPIPQYQNRTGTGFEAATGANGGVDQNIIAATTIETRLDTLHTDAAASNAGLGTTADAEAAAGNGTAIAILKALRTKLGGVILAAGDALIGRVKISDGTTVAEVDALTKGLKTKSQSVAQPLISQLMDFKGKTSAQTFDVPHVSKYRLATTFDAPTVGGTEFATSSYAYLNYQDNSCITVGPNSVNGNYAQTLFSFDVLNDLKNRGLIPKSWTVTELKAAIKQIVWSWYGYGIGSNGGVSTNGATLKAWLPGTTAWGFGATNLTSAPSLVTNNTKVAADVMDDSGKVNILAYSTYASDGTIASTIYTDYVSLTVTLAPEYLLTDTARVYDGTTKALQVKPVTAYNAMRQGVTGTKTVTTTAAEFFAGSSARLANRFALIVRCPIEATEPLLYGYSSTTCVRKLNPGDERVFQFDPLTATPIYFKTTTASVTGVEGEELA